MRQPAWITSSPRTSTSYDGRSSDELAAVLDLPRVLLFDEVSSTLDIVHELGEQGAPAGTLVLADSQTAGRGRLGRPWQSAPGAGVWLTLLERPASGETLGVLALRLALALAPALDQFAKRSIQLKWPNDLFVAGRKLAGVLVEARWRGSRFDWLAVGVGINVRPPGLADAVGLEDNTDRASVLRAIVPALRAAVATQGPLSPEELARFRERDLAVGKRCVAPARGVVTGVRSDGALLLEGSEGPVAFHAGSLILEANSLGTST